MEIFWHRSRMHAIFVHSTEFEFKENLMVINDVHFPLRIGFSFSFSVCLFNAHPFAIVIMIIGNFNDDDECFQLDNLWILHTPSHHMACHFVKYQFTFSLSLSLSPSLALSLSPSIERFNIYNFRFL